MPYYDITVFEVHTQKFCVHAEAPAEAIKLVEERVDVCRDGGPVYLEDANDYGTPIREIARTLNIPFDDLLKQFEEAQISLDGDDDPETVFIPAISSVELSADQDN